jgi:hypothetical protein
MYYMIFIAGMQAVFYLEPVRKGFETRNVKFS